MQENKLNNIPLVSIVLPVYNGEKFLAKSIESCLNQTYQNLELIIVNDCSTDNTLEIALLYASKDNRIRILNNTENKKLPASLNIGHKQAIGDYFTWTSDDNFYEFNAIETLLNALIENKVDIVYSNIFLINQLGENKRESNFVDFENVLFGNYIGACFLYAKGVFDRNAGYKENLFLVEDYDFWLRAIEHSVYFQLKRNLYSYRKHTESLTFQITADNAKNLLWRQNIALMYRSFSDSIVSGHSKVLANWQTKRLTHQSISFEWIKCNQTEIKQIINAITVNINFKNIKKVKKVFLTETIAVMINDQKSKNNLVNSVFIVKNYFDVLDKKNLKTLIKYLFFK
jgi:glycosyltransferase involved in cell wall biosynthesis